MCGIAGVINFKGIYSSDVELIKRMNQVQKHRGPDDEGIYQDSVCVLGHQRLAIIDLSSCGHQPFVSDDGRYQMIYNGEIYNYIELREELKRCGYQFKTQTDTEVLLKCYQHFGVDCLSKFNGMFAFAIYDTQNHQLFLGRDRVGVKPLYYTIQNSSLYFASEVKALIQIPGLDKSVDNQTIFDYLVFNRTDIYDETFFKNIRRLPKGHYAIFNRDGFSIRQWWDPLAFVAERVPASHSELLKEIEKIFIDAVRLRMRSDVPVGVSLSGGLDSSIVIGILAEHSNIPADFPTFTAAFPGESVDESGYIDALNSKYAFKNHRVSPSPEACLNSLKEFIYTCDEPTTGPSFYAEYEVAKLAKEHGVKVLLNGQGGDEDFAGYHYFHGFYLYQLLKQRDLVKFSSEFLKVFLNQQQGIAYQTLLFQLIVRGLKQSLLLKRHGYLQEDFFRTHIQKSRIFNEFFDAPTLNVSLARHFQYKLEHNLRMTDRNTMTFSIEARLPYLDYRFVEYLLGIAGHLKIKAGQTKFLQKEALGRYTAPEILERKDKIGFAVPEQKWWQQPRWIEQTQAASRDCEDTFAHIFKRDVFPALPRDEFSYWKINQLSNWHQVFVE
ncbi:MAG: asparagine synthase (glutamine-hydrolyzing) [Candidatus Omnitrophica bacterium]|nr:asparagine synthase (glutamine-hydrolyzing) [Candidatus Omnitrophota bacterium]